MSEESDGDGFNKQSEEHVKGVWLKKLLGEVIHFLLYTAVASSTAAHFLVVVPVSVVKVKVVFSKTVFCFLDCSICETRSPESRNLENSFSA